MVDEKCTIVARTSFQPRSNPQDHSSSPGNFETISIVAVDVVPDTRQCCGIFRSGQFFQRFPRFGCMFSLLVITVVHKSGWKITHTYMSDSIVGLSPGVGNKRYKCIYQ